MNVNFRQLRAFATVARLGNFTRAASALHATQPALSAQIRDLETTLGIRLFDRSTRSVTLTQAGADLLPVVDSVLADLGSVIERARDVAHRNTGRIAVAALPSLSASLLPEVIATMRRDYPGIAVVVRDALAEKSLSLLRADEVDLALTSAPTADGQLHFTPLLEDRMVAVLPLDHPLVGAKTIRLVDLLDSPLVLMDRDSSVRRSVDAACASIGRIATPVYEAAFMATAIGLAGAGLGATLLPSSAAELQRTAKVVVRNLDVPRIERDLGVVRQKRRPLSPAGEAFVATLTNVVRERARETRSPRAAKPRRRGGTQ